MPKTQQHQYIVRKKENYLATKLPEVIFAVLKTKWRVGQGVKTPPFHGGITGSNPVRATKSFSEMESFFDFRKLMFIL